MDKDALALKYRPKKIADLVGQDHVKQVLTNSIKKNKCHHAYIFAGKFGCGKTSTARIFAASVNNPSGMSLDPDLDNDLVRRIYAGKHPDIKELDAAATRSIDDIREIKQEIQFNPLECRKRFVVIDEAHRLTGAAAEAALKMIEEPPKNCIFILCTTDPEKLKDTIHSRCLPLRFNKIPWSLAFQHLKVVAKAEGIEFEEQALKIAARKSKGSMRNALQNLQMLITFAGGEGITTEIAQKALSAVDEGHYFDLVDSIIKPDAGEAMRIIDMMIADGRDVGEVLDGFVGHLRNLMIIKTCPSTKGLIYLTEEEKKRFVYQLEKLQPLANPAMFLIEMIEYLGKVNEGINLNLNPQTMLESLVVRSIMRAHEYKRMAQKS